MKPRISLITLGVADLPKSRAFYERLGFAARQESTEDIAFMDTANGLVLALFPREKLAEDAHADSTGSGFRGFTLAHNVASPEEVDAVLAEAVAAGATLQNPGRKCSGAATRAISPTRTGSCGKSPITRSWI